jgi:hypothetical protein
MQLRLLTITIAYITTVLPVCVTNLIYNYIPEDTRRVLFLFSP